MSIGSDLRQAREQQGLTLRDLSERTKIRAAVLRGIEQDTFDRTIGAVIMRGFLKLYAREVGLDPADVARRYDEVAGTPQADPSLHGGLGAGATSAAPRSGVTRMAVAGIVLIALVGGTYAWRVSSARPDAAASPAAPGTGATPRGTANPESAAGAAPAQPPATVPAATPPPAATAPPAATPTPPVPIAAPPADAPARPAETTTPPANTPVVAGTLRVEIEATGETWLAATADGRQVAYRVLNAGERVGMDVKEEAVLRIGAPGNLTVTINGRPVRPPARPGTPTTLRITPDTYRDLLVP
jgi:cytoskeleton protein RodZ